VWDEKGSLGPPRRIYSITESGEGILIHFMQWLKASRQQIEHMIAIYENSPSKNRGDDPSSKKEEK
jgi:DNA-binding PadR family transcriptional regulator